MGIRIRVLILSALALMLATGFSGCLNSPGLPSSKLSSSSLSSVNGTTATSTSASSLCAIFSSSAIDFNSCISCVNTLGTGVSSTALVQCVHANTLASGSGGFCAGLSCGSSQVADLTSCVCRDATSNSATIISQPGLEDQTAPYMEPGFYVGNRFCSASSATLSDQSTHRMDCLLTNGGSGPIKTLPQYTTDPPSNVVQDLGYVRWDLSMDASQFPAGTVLANGQKFTNTWSTLPLTFSLFYQLKPGTELSTNTVQWQDCAEHFSGFNNGGTDSFTTANFCQIRTGGLTAAPDALSVPLVQSGASGSAVVNKVSLSGSAANFNITQTGVSASDKLQMGVGLHQRDNIWSLGTAFVGESGLASNIGTYKYSWGPLRVRKAGTLVDVASSVVTGQVSMNTNFGFTPVGAVDSTAFSIDALSVGTVNNRVCSTPLAAVTSNSQCAVTALYRTSGGQILYQTFTPQISSHASSVASLPIGITAASTPKVIEDTSQLLPNNAASTNVPARLRAFVRGADGNIYMSRGQGGKWFNWQSLGRPWIANTTSPFITLAKALWPFTELPNALTQTSQTEYDGGINNGISIAGEPVVASFMETTTSGGSTVLKGAIAVLVRVSHTLSNGAGFGYYHNAVFYTFAVAGNTYPTDTTPLDFDDLTYWSPWMPVMDDADSNGALEPIRFTGNPTAFMSNITATPRIFLFGNHARPSETNIAGNTAFPTSHPPIAPNNNDIVHPYFSAVNPYTAVNPGQYGTGNGANGSWYNYPLDATRTMLDISTFFSNAGIAVSAPSTITPSTPLTWGTAEALDPDGVGPTVFVSDWTKVPTGFSHRLCSMMIQDVSFQNDTNGGTTKSYSVAPIGYQRRMACFDFTESGAVTSGLAAFGVPPVQEVSFNAQFWGGMSSVRLPSNATVASSIDPDVATDHVAGGAMIFGRTICPTGVPCDKARPTPAYAVTGLDSNLLCTGGRKCAGMFYGGNNVDSDSTIRTPSLFKMSPVLLTSDIVAVQNSALSSQGYDVPVYLFSRGADGKLIMGLWDSKNTLTSGNSFFRWFSVGSSVY